VGPRHERMADQCAPSSPPSPPPLRTHREPAARPGWRSPRAIPGEGPAGELRTCGDLSGATRSHRERARTWQWRTRRRLHRLGHSEWPTAMFAWHLGPSYGQERFAHGGHVRRAAVAVPYIYDALQTSPTLLPVHGGAGYNIPTQPGAPLTAVLTRTPWDSCRPEEGVLQLPRIHPRQVLDGPAGQDEPVQPVSWKVLLTKNDPRASRPTTSPAHLPRCADEQIPCLDPAAASTSAARPGPRTVIYPPEPRRVCGGCPRPRPLDADRFAGDPDPTLPADRRGRRTGHDLPS